MMKRLTVEFQHPAEEWLAGEPFTFWIYDIIKLASLRQLNHDDVWPSPQNQSMEYAAKRLNRFWLKEMKEAHQSNRKESLARAIFNAYRKQFLTGGLLHFFSMIFMLSQPYFIGQLVISVSDPTIDVWTGVGWALGLGAVNMMGTSILLTVSWNIMRDVGLAVRGGMMMAVYDQALKITAIERQLNSVGQTVNLMSIDCEKFVFAIFLFNFLWAGPVMALIIMALLILEVGVFPSLVGMAWIFLLIPVQSKMASLIGLYRRDMAKHSDTRVKLINEILQIIRIIKFYAWEVPMEERVVKERSLEIDALFKYLRQNGYLRELLFMAGPISTILIFSTLVYGLEQSLDYVKVFRALAFINISRLPLNLLGQALRNFNDALVSVERLRAFFLLPTLPGSTEELRFDDTDDPQGKTVESPSVVLTNATFAWQEKVVFVAAPGAIVPTIEDADKSDSDDNDGDVNVGSIDTSISGSSVALRSINLSVNPCDSKGKGSLIAVIGSVGSGKSSLISAMLGEIPLIAGTAEVRGRLAYCAQTPWIQNMSLRDNILFGADIHDPAIAKIYSDALDAAALRPDIAILPAGDETEIGERGINLSGGQKARVSIARALVARDRSDIILMDDPFSAVDGSTGNHIFEQGVRRFLNGKITILALNSHMHLLGKFDRVVVLDHGCVVADAPLRELQITHADLIAKVTGVDGVHENEDLLEAEEAGEAEETNLSQKFELPNLKESVLLNEEENKDIEANIGLEASEEASGRETPSSVASPTCDTSIRSLMPTESSVVATHVKDTGKILIQEEKRAIGDIPLSVYLLYFGAPFVSLRKNNRSSVIIAGAVYTFTMVLFFMIAQVARVAVDFYLMKWATVCNGAPNCKFVDYFYISFGVLAILLFARVELLNRLAIRSGQFLVRHALKAVLSAPITTFFDTHTLGEILNRFSKDTDIVETILPEFINQVLQGTIMVLSAICLCIWTTPYFILVMLPMSYYGYRVYVLFGHACRDLKRLESVSRSPLYASFSETLTGLVTIRAYGDAGRFKRNHLLRMELNGKHNYHFIKLGGWLMARMELFSASFLVAVALLAVTFSHTESLSSEIGTVQIGLALIYGLQITGLFQRSITLILETQGYMTSTQRLLEYVDIPSECSVLSSLDQKRGPVSGSRNEGNFADITSTTNKSPSTVTSPTLSYLSPQWPRGIIEFKEVQMQYRDNPLVLKGVSFRVEAGQRVGVCGRTGAGKSSLMIALFRIAELTSGSILIDGVNIASVPLHILRSKLAIIPQDPVLLTGDIRFQLDPFKQNSDLQIWEALRSVNMDEYVRSLSGGLGEQVAEGGENLSLGQRQLLCIARALLRRAAILVIDEGTSAVDQHTDQLVQKVLREAAAVQGTTVLAIAHRLQTILDFDRILVMDRGVVSEFDSPANLLKESNSIFYSMMQESKNH